MAPRRDNRNDVASFVLAESTWAVLALTCHIELFSQAHYRASHPHFQKVLSSLVDDAQMARIQAALAPLTYAMPARAEAAAAMTH